MNRQIKVYPRTEIEELSPKDDRITLNFKKDASKLEEITDYLLFAIGRDPTTPSMINKLEIEKEKDKTIFFVGDVKNERYRQCSFAVSDGIKAAMVIERMIRRDNHENR